MAKYTLDQVIKAATDTVETAAQLAKQGVKTAGKAADSAVLYAKTQAGILELRRQIDQRLRQVGELTYAQHIGEGSDEGTIETLLLEIDGLYEELQEKTEAAQSVKGKKVCPNCGEYNSLRSLFCSSCGSPLTVTYSSRDFEEDAPIEVPHREVTEEDAIKQEDEV